MPAHSPSATNVFDAAKAIVAVLEGLDKQHQIQAMRFASETLGLGTAPLGHPPTPPTPNPLAPTPLGSGGGHSTDIKQFTEGKDPKSDQQFTAVVAYYYRFLAPEAQRRDTITAELMNSAARGVWPQKRRWSMTLTNAKNAGYLDPAGKGEFKLSAVGENLVAMTLPGDEAARPARGGRKKKPGTPKVRAKKRSRHGG